MPNHTTGIVEKVAAAIEDEHRTDSCIVVALHQEDFDAVQMLTDDFYHNICTLGELKVLAEAARQQKKE